ncbi:MAG: hypothetical protein KDH15_20300 [Rhodocyclaceae bacterium]|nr:hypothetical protein [Rhodocyclaceae bacterium]
MSTTPDLASFTALVGQTFRLEVNGDKREQLELTQVKALPVRAGAPRSEGFSLLFRAQAGCGLSQGIVHLENPQLGSLELFLVPVAEDQDGLFLEAVFN